MELDGDGRMPVLHFGMTGMLQVNWAIGRLLLMTFDASLSIGKGRAAPHIRRQEAQQAIGYMAAPIYQGMMHPHLKASHL